MDEPTRELVAEVLDFQIELIDLIKDVLLNKPDYSWIQERRITGLSLKLAEARKKLMPKENSE